MGAAGEREVAACQSSALMAVARAFGLVPRCERRAEVGAATAAGRVRWGDGERGTAGESFALCRVGRVHRHSLDGHNCLQRTWSCPCEYVLTWDLCGQHFLKNHSFHRVSNRFSFCFHKEIFKSHDGSNAINSLLSAAIIMILIFLGPFLWFKTD